MSLIISWNSQKNRKFVECLLQSVGFLTKKSKRAPGKVLPGLAEMNFSVISSLLHFSNGRKGSIFFIDYVLIKLPNRVPITGPGHTSGKLFSNICKRVGLLYGRKRMEFFYETRRVLDDQRKVLKVFMKSFICFFILKSVNRNDPNYDGTVGTSFCDSKNHDRSILEKLREKAHEKGWLESFLIYNSKT